MRPNFKHLLIIVLAIFQLFAAVSAIEDNNEDGITDEVITPELESDAPVLVSEIEYNDVIQKAILHCYDLKIADFNVLIARQGVRSAKSEYFPKLFASASTEYTRNFRDTRESTVMSVGESFINPYTRFQNVFGVTLSYNLFDFGVRKASLQAAKTDVLIKELQEKEAYQDLILNVIDTYTKVLIANKQIKINTEIVKLLEKNLEYVQRLCKAKVLASIELNNIKVALEQARRDVNELKSIRDESLNWLAFYTGEEYNKDEINISDIEKPDFDPFEINDYSKSLTWKIREKQIIKKEFELKAQQRANYPKVNAYSRYYLYGSDKDRYGKSMTEIEPSNYTVGGTIMMPVFDGFKNSADVQRIKLELQQLYVERDKAIAELTTKLSIMRSNLIHLNAQGNNNNKISKELNIKHISNKKLADKKIIMPYEANNAKIELLKQKIETEKNNINSIAIIKGIEVLVQEY